MSTTYTRKCIEERGFRYQQLENLEKTRKGKGIYVVKDNNLWSLLAQNSYETEKRVMDNNRTTRRKLQHIFEKHIEKQRNLKKNRRKLSNYKPKFWAHSEIKWDPTPGFQNEADKRPRLGGKTRFEFEQTLKQQEKKKFDDSLQIVGEIDKKKGRILQSRVPIGWEIGTSWNPAKSEEDRFCTVYQSMQLAKKANNKTGVYFRKSAARIQYSSLTLG